jgi:hypothetical protein
MAKKKNPTPPKWEKVRACYRALAEQIEQIRMMEDKPQILIDALSAWARYTEVSRYFPDLTHVCTAEAIYCMGYRQAIISNEGCDCSTTYLVTESEDKGMWTGGHNCNKWYAIFAREWATKISELVIRGYTEKQLYWVCRSLNSLCTVPELNAPPKPDAPDYNPGAETNAPDADYKVNPFLRVWLFLVFMWRLAPVKWEESATGGSDQ